MAFIPHGTLDSNAGPVLYSVILGNTITSVIQDSMKSIGGFSVLGTAGVVVLGHVVAHASKEGTGLLTTGVAGAEMGSYAYSFATASDNQTVAKVVGRHDVSKFTLYSAEMSATIGTTTGSNLAGYNLDLSDANTLDETSATQTATAQYQNIIGLDPNDSARSIVNILESKIFGGSIA